MTHDPKAVVEDRQNALRRLNELRTPLREAIIREILRSAIYRCIME
jgi:hypothetical protein